MGKLFDISKNRAAKYILGLALICLIGGLLIAASLQKHKQHIQNINYVNKNTRLSVIPTSFLNQLLAEGLTEDIQNIPLTKINLEKIEEVFESYPWIANAEVFIDNKKSLQIELYERIPVARIFSIDGKSYYMDSTTHLMSADVSLPTPVPVFTSIPYLSNDEMSQKIAASIAYLGEMISKDSFWNAQITQINMLPNGNFEMATIIGKHKIVFGDTTNAREKLDNLYVFYSKGLSKLGWDRYDKIDLRYRGQVVTSPGIDYIAPIITDTLVEMPDPDDNETYNNTTNTLKDQGNVMSNNQKQNESSKSNDPVAKTETKTNQKKENTKPTPQVKEQKSTEKVSASKKEKQKNNQQAKDKQTKPKYLLQQDKT